MKSHLLVVTAAIAVVGSSGLYAQSAPGGRSAAEISAEAIATAHSSDPTGSVGTRGFGYGNFVSRADPETVRKAAVDQASAPTPTGNDYTGGIGSKFTSTRDPVALAAEAREAAAAPDQNVASESKVNSTVIPSMPTAPTVAAK